MLLTENIAKVTARAAQGKAIFECDSFSWTIKRKREFDIVSNQSLQPHYEDRACQDFQGVSEEEGYDAHHQRGSRSR